MSIVSSRPDHRDDTRGNYHCGSVRAFSRAGEPGALGVVYSDGNRLWLDASRFSLNDGTCAHACGLQSQLVSLCGIVMNVWCLPEAIVALVSEYGVHQCFHARARETLESIFADRLNLGWGRPNAAQLRADAQTGGGVAAK
jgi:hypothetical protein